VNVEHYLKSDPQGEPAMIRGHCCGQPHAPGSGQLRAMTVSGQRRAAVGYRGQRLEREVDESGGWWSRWQSRTKENGYAADEVLGISAALYSIFDLIIFTPGGLGTASEKSVGGESILTILDKCDIQYLTLIFFLRSTWAGPETLG
jgi:hypothetical protein